MGSAVGARGENVSPGGHEASWGELGRLGPDFEPEFEPELGPDFDTNLAEIRRQMLLSSCALRTMTR